MAFVIFAISCSNDVEEWDPSGGGNTPPPTDSSEEVVWHERAKEIYDRINQYYRISSGAWSGLYNESYPKGSENSSYLWPYDGFVSGAASIYELGYDIDYTSLVDRFSSYWRTSGAVGVGGYGSTTDGTNGSGDRFFDDNSIVGLDLVEAYRLTGDEKYITQAGQIVQFLLSGEDDTFGGGLWWNESKKNIQGDTDSNKPACANSFATLFLLEYYDICPDAEKSEVLAFAKRLYSWLVTNLRDTDGCYWNDRQASGDIRTVKYTYNTGAMISNGVRLFRITADQSYLDDAIASAQGSYNYFVKPNPGAGLALAYPSNDPWFTTKLVKSYIDIEPYYKAASAYIDTFADFAEHAWNNARQANGLFYEDWTGQKQEPDRDKTLLMQDAALESFGMIALYKGEKVEDKTE